MNEKIRPVFADALQVKIQSDGTGCKQYQALIKEGRKCRKRLAHAQDDHNHQPHRNQKASKVAHDLSIDLYNWYIIPAKATNTNTIKKMGYFNFNQPSSKYPSHANRPMVTKSCRARLLYFR